MVEAVQLRPPQSAATHVVDRLAQPGRRQRADAASGSCNGSGSATNVGGRSFG
jgi:hypothetical protein